MTARKTKAPSIPVPKTREAAEMLLFNIGAAQRRLAVIEAKMNDLLAASRVKFEAEAQPLNEQIESDFASLHAWAEANRDELLEGKAKTVKLATGELSWRTTPPSVRLTKPEDVIARLKGLGLASSFVRTKEEIDKQAILADPTAVKDVKGISISQKEEFVAKPFESQIEKAETSTTSTTEVRRAG